MNNKNYTKLLKKIDKDLLNIYNKGPKSLIETYKYTFSATGKRIRPLLTILTSKSINGDYKKSYNAALAIEILHNFTLVHDDIMDNDSMRHGKKTLHERWDTSTAILAGDAMLAISLNLLTNSKYNNKILKAFNKGLLTVCEGQALDKEFEKKETVSEKEYLDMIEKKTSHLIAMPIEIGALVYGVNKEDIKKLFKFGICIGKAFQIQDDFLEITSNSKEMKKSLNSDILLDKKTYPILLCKQKNNKFITKLMNNKNPKEIIRQLREFIIENNIDKKINKKIDKLYDIGLNSIKTIKFKNSELLEFVKLIKERKK
tara:strand:+ start:1572 stop:2516 length:945 start_codon:yes stop_codon:yes gene_type:complete